jgi:predicted polyphosphate/ATP-dependent NAD kinase
MKIISENKYSMPIGFNKHSAYGIKSKAQKYEQENHWQEIKKMEIQQSRVDVLQSKNSFTEKALSIARKIVELSKVEVNGASENGIRIMLDRLNNELKQLVGQGADVKIVKDYLQNNLMHKYNTINKMGKVA